MSSFSGFFYRFTQNLCKSKRQLHSDLHTLPQDFSVTYCYFDITVIIATKEKYLF